jgi:hypothetical protein
MIAALAHTVSLMCMITIYKNKQDKFSLGDNFSLSHLEQASGFRGKD